MSDVEKEDSTPMTSLEHTAYPLFTRVPYVKELQCGHNHQLHRSTEWERDPRPLR